MTKHARDRFPSMCIAAACLIMGSSQLHANEVQVGRYTLRSIAPTKAQSDLLAATVTIRFPDRMQTIGEAVRYLLRNSGYRLAGPVAIDPETKALFRLPLPVVHRHLGPLTMRRALETLAGSAFRLVQDPVHRLIAFELCAKGWGQQAKPEATIKKVRVPEGKPATIEGGR